MNMGNRYMQVTVLLGLGIAAQFLASSAGAEYYLTQLTMSAYYAVVVIGLCMLMGYAGQISLGHAGFFAMGGYVSAVLTTYNLLPYREAWAVRVLDAVGLLVERQGLYGEPVLHMWPWAACVLAVAVTAGVAYLIGGPVLRLKGHYLAMATLGFGTIIYRIVVGTPIFGEADGINGVPAFPVLPGVEVSGRVSIRVENFYIAWTLMSLGVLMLLNLVNSRVGRALRAIHGAEDAAGAMGVDTAACKLHVFVLSAAYAAVAGVFLTHFNGGIGPSEAGIIKSVRYVSIVAVGGMANLWGALVMGLLLNFLSLRGYFGSLDDAVFGGILIVIMLFAPQGLLRRQGLSAVRSLLTFRAPGRGEEA